jgi:hypothetical protein
MTMNNLQLIMQKEREKIGPKGGKESEKHKEELAKLGAYYGSLEHRLLKPRFFPGGVKLDDLVEFKLWQIQADRLGIRLEGDHLQKLVEIEFSGSSSFSRRSGTRGEGGTAARRICARR